MLISGHFRITQGNQNQLIQSRKIICNWEKKIFSGLSQKKRFLEPMKKNPYTVNYWWKYVSVSNYAYSTILVITKIYKFLLLYFTPGLLLIMWSKSVSIVWTVTSTAALYHCWSYREHSDLWTRCIYIFDIYSMSLWDVRIYLISDLINVKDT